jgi:predicted acylesterase/phospholipase RssA
MPAAWLLGFSLLLLIGCAGQTTRQPLPQRQASQASPVGMPADVRYWGDDPSRGLSEWLSLPDSALAVCCSALVGRPHEYLLVSSGGDNGAFGAGLLVGWSAAGTRPDFEVVTGVSTGAIIAFFAFLGPDYDAALREVYTRHSGQDLVAERDLPASLRTGAVYDTAPFRRLIDRYIGDAEVARLAAESRKGRRLLVGTTNLDAARPVIWDLTRIAASGAPNARQLIGDLILASSAIPGLFPPVLISVEVDGRRYDEMHVDGGVTSQLFLDPGRLDWAGIARRLDVQGQPQVYVIRNGRLHPRLTALRAGLSPALQDSMTPAPRDGQAEPEWKEVPARVSPILQRSLIAMLRARGIGEAVEVYARSDDGALGFHLASIPDDFDYDPDELFDGDYMRALFDRAFDLAQSAQAWTRVPAR